jgi:6-phosphogluconolactonase
MPRARLSYGLLTSQDQGGGDKKQGLPPSVGKGHFIFNLIKRKAWPSEKKDEVKVYKYFAYVANSGSLDGVNGLSAYQIDPNTGALSEIIGSPFTTGYMPYSVAIDPTGKFAYVANYDSNDVSAYTINPNTGALTEISESPFTAGDGPRSVAFDRTGKFAYVANSGSADGVNGLSAYTINPNTGALSVIIGSPFTTGAIPFSVKATGKFAYVANFNTTTNVNDISAYTINQSTGALSEIIDSPFTAGVNPASVAIDPTGKFAYVANNGSDDGVNGLSAYTINQNTGALSAIIGSPFTTGYMPYSVAIDPTGKFAYVANNGSDDGVNGLSAYTINQNTGALSAIIGSPFTTGFNPSSVAVDPNGKFAYVTNNGSDDVSAYTINPNTGALSALSGSSFTAGDGPYSIITVRILVS